MPDILVKNLERDGATREFAGHGRAVLADAGACTLMRAVFEPGWRWSTDMAPLAGTATCHTRHLGYLLTGRMQIRMDDGTEFELGPGDLFDLPAGHDAWVLGDEPCEMIDVSPESTRYATSRTGAEAADDRWMTLVRRGYAAFNSGDLETLRQIMAADVVQHVPGSSPLAGTYKGQEAVFGYYGRLAELTGGTFRAHLVDVHGDGAGHVTAVHVTSGERNGERYVGHGSILFSFLGDKATDLLELRGDAAADDAFLA